MHLPVLVREVVEVFSGQKLAVFFDGTVGAGGHARSIFEAHPEIERYIACDRDESALSLAEKNLAIWGKKVDWVHGSFAECLSHRGKIDGFLLDLGVSSMQFDQEERGFSFRFDAPLDMRMDKSAFLTAEEILNRRSESELAHLFFTYGEEPRSRAAARAIVHARKKRPIRTTKELVEILFPVLRKGRIHPATRIFQALRIAVNDELGELERGLASALDHLALGGRGAVIAFHSLEDRLVKHRFRDDKRLFLLTKKPIRPSLEEIRSNPRSRSAKLRAVERMKDT